MKKIALLGIIVAVVAFAVFFRIKSINSKEASKREGIETIQKREGFPVEVVKLQSGRFAVWREIPGKIKGYCESLITTTDLARVESIRYKVGDYVKADTPIISLDENDPKNRSQIKLLRNVNEDALKEYERYQSLYDSGGVSEGALDKFRLKLARAKTILDAANSSVHLTSPFSGTMVALYARVGENAEPNKTLAIVSSLDRVRVVAGVGDRDAQEIEKGQPVTVRSSKGVEHDGYVDRISIGANPRTGLFDIELVVNNPESLLKVGTYVTAKIRIFFQENAAFVDSRSILRDYEGRDFVFQVDSNIARKVAVTVNAANDDFSLLCDISSALPIVLRGQEQLNDGAKVRILSPEEK